MTDALIPDDPLAFIRDCVAEGRIRWTYHVSMRLHQRKLTREALTGGAGTLEIIESYPEDKYLPSFLARGLWEGLTFHAHIATDVSGNNIRVVTMYEPNPADWENNGRSRRIAQ